MTYYRCCTCCCLIDCNKYHEAIILDKTTVPLDPIVHKFPYGIAKQLVVVKGIQSIVTSHDYLDFLRDKRRIVTFLGSTTRRQCSCCCYYRLIEYRKPLLTTFIRKIGHPKNEIFERINQTTLRVSLNYGIYASRY